MPPASTAKTARASPPRNNNKASRAICTAPLADLELVVEQIAVTISQRINPPPPPPPELLQAQRLTDTMTVVGVGMAHHYTELKLLRVGADSLCAICR